MSSALFKQFKTDSTKEREGILVNPCGPNDDGTTPTFRLARRSPANQKYAKALERETAPYRRMIELGTLDGKTADKVFMKIFCKSVLLGWEHVQDENGVLIPHTEENAIKLFETLPDLYDELFSQSAKASLFRETTAEGDAKN